MSSLGAAVPAARSIIYLGMDVHKDSITIAVLPEHAKAPTRVERLPNELPKLKKWLARPDGRRLARLSARALVHDPRAVTHGPVPAGAQ